MTSYNQRDPKLDQQGVVDAYARWAPIYDFIFTQVMKPGREAVSAATRGRGRQRILDVGVGTGLELPMLDREVRVVGVDLSRPMLRRAQERVAAQNLHNVEGFAVMDAVRLGFADAVFDVVIAPFVLTVVPDPAASLSEWVRVLKPGGEIVLVNHFGAERGMLARLEGWLGRRASKLGWHPQFPWATVADWLGTQDGVELVERRSLSPFGLFALTRLRKVGTPSS